MQNQLRQLKTRGNTTIKGFGKPIPESCILYASPWRVCYCLHEVADHPRPTLSIEHVTGKEFTAEEAVSELGLDKIFALSPFIYPCRIHDHRFQIEIIVVKDEEP